MKKAYCKTRITMLLLNLALGAAMSVHASPHDGIYTRLYRNGPYPPVLPGGVTVATDTAPEFIQMPPDITFTGKFTVAKVTPTIDFTYYPGQDRVGNPWSVWGDGAVVSGKYYSSICDHKFDAYVYEYDTTTRNLRILLETTAFLNLPTNDYRPGKIHSKIGVGKDGCLYYSTHRGAASYTEGEGGKKRNYKGDWVFKTDPATGQTEIMMHGEVPESIPAGQFDPERLIYYGGTQQSETFFAYDCARKKLLFKSEPGQGPQRYMIFSRTTSRVYFVGSSNAVAGTMGRYDPLTGEMTTLKLKLDRRFDIRSCTDELPGGIVYVNDYSGNLWKFDVTTEKPEFVAVLPIGKMDSVIASLDSDAAGRYLYYVGGGHGGITTEGMSIKQFDTRTRTIKVIAFLNPFYARKYNYNPDGTYGSALSPDGATLYVTMNGCLPPGAGAKNWYAVALFVIHIPESERKP